MSGRSCPWCGKPRATEDDYDRYEGGEGTHLCWADPYCEMEGDEEVVAALRAENERLRAAATEALAVLMRVADGAAYWSDYDVPVGIVSEIDAAKARLAGVLRG